MQIPQPTDADRAAFRALVPDDPRVEVNPMFGNLEAFVNGARFMSLFGAQIGLKLPCADAAALLAIDGAGPFGPSERPMGGYMALPSGMRGADATGWVAIALEHVAHVPPRATDRR